MGKYKKNITEKINGFSMTGDVSKARDGYYATTQIRDLIEALESGQGFEGTGLDVAQELALFKKAAAIIKKSKIGAVL